jgi:hypothetical protein
MVDAWGEDALPTVPNYDLKGNSTGDGNAVTRYTVLKLIVTEVSVDGCDCCVKAATSDYRIQTDFNTTRADVHTILHEQVHAYADWQLANVAFPLAIVGLKNHCLKAKHWTEEECKAAQQVEAAKATSAIDANANGLLNVMAHTMIGSVGWNATGQDKFTKWLGLWLPSWQDDMLRYRQGKFW